MADGQDGHRMNTVGIESIAIKSPARQSLRAILAPDPEVLAWAMAVRARFPDARPLYGTSIVGTIGRQP